MNTTFVSMQDTLTHCVAQQLCMGQDIYEYMQYVVVYLLEKEMDIEDIQNLYVHVYYNAQEESLVIKDMYARYGIKVDVEGHGGSQIHPRVLLEKYF